MRNYKLVVICWLIFMVNGCAQKNVQGGSSTGYNSGNQTPELQILCYNIHHANPPSKPGIIDLEAIAKVIRDHTPDLVALQEVDVNTIRSGKTSNQAAELARLSGMPHYFFAKAIDYEGGEYGVAILSKFPLEEMKNTQLPTEAETNGERRTLASAVVQLPGGKKIVFASTHLDALKGDTNRFLQINKITDFFQQEKRPVVIAGDLNAYPSTRIINRLDQFFKRSCIVDCAHTVPVVNPRNTIDYVAFAPAEKFTVTEHKVIDEKYASDHLPVKVKLSVK